MRRWVAAGVVVVLLGLVGTVGAGVVGVGGAAWAAAEPLGDCSTTSGVVVAVDFAHWGGPVLRACGSTPTSAYTLLNQGGWHTTGTEHDGPGFICRIGYAGFHGGTQYPTPAQDACVLTPPSTAYWAFWYANPGQDSWTYSQAGAMGADPVPGSVELWTFGGTTTGGASGSAVPPVTPGSLRARNASPPRTVKDPGSHPATKAPGTPGTAATTHAAAAASHPPNPGGGTTVTPAVSNAPPTTAAAPAGHGSAAPALLALVIVVILAAIGIVAVLRRPRREQ